MTFFAEWLQLPKEQFRILVMLADIGTFRGSLADMCRYFSVDPQTHNRNRLRAAIDELTHQGFLVATRAGNTYQMSLIPKDEEITMPAEWVARIRRHEYHTENVAWEIVLKVQLWLMQYANGIITNNEIAADVDSSASQVCAAKNVLQREYEAFIKHYAYSSTTCDFFQRKGQVIDMAAWWN